MTAPQFHFEQHGDFVIADPLLLQLVAAGAGAQALGLPNVACPGGGGSNLLCTGGNILCEPLNVPCPIVVNAYCLPDPPRNIICSNPVCG